MDNSITNLIPCPRNQGKLRVHWHVNLLEELKCTLKYLLHPVQFYFCDILKNVKLQEEKTHQSRDQGRGLTTEGHDGTFSGYATVLYLDCGGGEIIISVKTQEL